MRDAFPQKELLSDEELQKKREEVERKARRGEIDPMHEYVFQVICQVSRTDMYLQNIMIQKVTGMMKHEMMEFIFEDPTIMVNGFLELTYINSRMILSTCSRTTWLAGSCSTTRCKYRSHSPILSFPACLGS